MKKLLLGLLIALSFSLNAQKKFSGVWVPDESAYTTTVLATEYKVLKIFNVSLSKNNFIAETIISQSGDTIKTALYNPKNNYLVSKKYYLKNKDTLVTSYTGDYEGLVLLTRPQINK